MPAVAGEQESDSLSLFVEVHDMEVQKELSTMATLSWAEGVWMGRWKREQQKAWRKRIFAVQRWKKARRLAEAVMCETRDLGIQWPQWHTLLFGEQVAVDMRVVCLQFVKNMTLKRARMVLWRKMGSQS